MWKSSTARNVAAPLESDCNERAPDLFNGHCGCRQRFGRSILSIGTSTPHNGHLTVFVSSISMRMADAKEKAYWEQPATGCSARRAVGRRPRLINLSDTNSQIRFCRAGSSARPSNTQEARPSFSIPENPEGRASTFAFGRLQKFCEAQCPLAKAS